MPLIVHHLQVSQSERVPWLCEELGIDYSLKLHQRAPIFSPKSILDLNPLGQAPVIEDDGLKQPLAESAACVEYISAKYGNNKLVLPPSHPNYADYLYWFHFSNGGFQPLAMLQLTLARNGLGESEYADKLRSRFHKALQLMDDRLKMNDFLAGKDFTLADIMIVFSLTTGRMFLSFDLSKYGNVLAYLKRCTSREGYKRARAKADTIDVQDLIQGTTPKTFFQILKETGKL